MLENSVPEVLKLVPVETSILVKYDLFPWISVDVSGKMDGMVQTDIKECTSCVCMTCCLLSRDRKCYIYQCLRKSMCKFALYFLDEDLCLDV